MSILTAIETLARRLRVERDSAPGRGLDAPMEVQSLTLRAAIGTLHMYDCVAPTDRLALEDTPITIVPGDAGEPTEGVVLRQRGTTLWLQVVESVGHTQATATVVPDATAFLDAVARRLTDIATKPHVYTLGPAERLAGFLDADLDRIRQVSAGTPSAVVTSIWSDVLAERRTRLAALLLELVRSNKKVLLIGPDQHTVDDVLGAVARNLKASGLPYKSHVTRYELALAKEVQSIPLGELGFEAQMHSFFAKSRSDKAALRSKYERFRELTPILAYKAQKQQELDEVRLLEWRLMTQLTEHRTKIAEIDLTVASYEALPIWKRVTMQAVGKNVATLGEYRAIHEQHVAALTKEVDIAKARIAELSPEAAVPLSMRPEYDELKEEVIRLGGTKKIRELLAAEEGTNRQAFIQNRRVVATTAARAVTDPLFGKVRFDVLVVDEAPWVPAAFVLGVAALVRERIVLSGNPADFSLSHAWETGGTERVWRSMKAQSETVA
ncbi:hypothetical protein YTPLAS18_00660 [Nitrospira sp.]|nr:hypothetical protein YTPLAS18_00660 [Nitrospira sp.]